MPNHKYKRMTGGILYQNFSKSFDTNALDYIFTMMLNTDGIFISHKFNLSIRPV